MYPNLYFLFQDLFGLEFPFLKLVNSFGLMVALAFVVSSVTLSLELKRKGREGLLSSTFKEVEVGHPASPLELISSGLFGFLVGYKVLWLMLNAGTLFDGLQPPQAHLFSAQGYWGLGLLLAAVMAYLRYREAEAQKLDKPRKEKIEIQPHQRTATITMVAAVGGVAGAKFFHLLEYPEELVQFFTDPSLQSFLGGLTIYGGLIVGGLSVAWYSRKHGLGFNALSDAVAPGLMLGYGVGRIGCQVSGDGDWGIPNTSPMPEALSWLPEWMWSYNFPNNVNGVYGPQPAGYTGKLITEADPWPIFEGFGTYLSPGVYPTAFYETLMAFAIFGVLWSIRKRLKVPGMLFALYLFLNGMERFWIEKIRVNVKMDFLGLQITQAELIATLMMLAGAALFWIHKKRAKGPAH